MAVTNALGNNVRGDLKPKDYFGQIDNNKKLQSKKVKETQSFQKTLKADLGKLNSNDRVKGLKSIIKESREVQAHKYSNTKTANGTDFALRKLSEDFEKQILGIMWNLVFESMNKEFEGGIGEEIFHKELVNEMVNLSRTGEMGEIATSIYLDLSEKAKNEPINLK
jgi:hypothetical protein